MTLAQQARAKLSPEEQQLRTERLIWLALNRGALRMVRDKTGIAPTTARRVYYGEIATAGNRAEREFAALGAPGFDEFRA